jgi:predicted RNA-binding protein YlxR (DUF448 family)
MKKLIRRCAQCRVLNHRSLMVRLQLRPDGSLTINADGCGRSLYLCRTGPCLHRAAQNKALLKLLPGITPEAWRKGCQAIPLTHPADRN